MISKTKCPACGAPEFSASDGTCGRCGYAGGEMNRCPHCGATARTEDKDDGSTVCAVCGGPRITGNYGGEAGIAALREQKKHLGAARVSSVSTVLQGIGATLVALLGLAIHPETITGRIVFLAFAIAPLLLALRSRSRANSARGRAKEASERAWQAAAEDIAGRAKDGITAATLAKTLRVPADRADQLLTTLTVNDRARIDVDDEAEVRYSVAPQIRVDPDDPEVLGERTIETLEPIEAKPKAASAVKD